MLNNSLNFSNIVNKAGLYFFNLSNLLSKEKLDKKLNGLIQNEDVSKIQNFIEMGLNKDMVKEWPLTSCQIVQVFMKDLQNQSLIDSLVKAQKFDNSFFTQYLYVQKDYCWIDTLINFSNRGFYLNQNIKKSYSYLINYTQISESNKAAIDSRLLDNLLDSPVLEPYSDIKGNYLSLANVLSNISMVIDNGYIFKNKITAFRSLLRIFSNNMVTENLPVKKLHDCLEHFSDLSVMAKKVIFKNLIKKKQEVIILNLFNRGIDLNWMIDFEGNGQTEVCSLKILENLKLSDVLLSTMDWNMLAKNSFGDNILHIMCGSSLLDGNLPKLNIKISYLSAADKHSFLNEKNDKGLTPLTQAILFRDECMVDFLIESGVNKWESLKSGVNPLEFIENCINGVNRYLLPESLQFNEVDVYFWHNLLKEWNSEKLFKELNLTLDAKKKKEKSIKI